jgi:protein-S-isoprenylcysteine O-methyltransferase Ste14
MPDQDEHNGRMDREQANRQALGVRRCLPLVYAIACAAAYFAVAAWTMAWLSVDVVPTGIGEVFRLLARRPALTASAWSATAVNIALAAAFAVQHSGMARRGFKRWWAARVPPPAERSTYVLASSVAWLLLVALWQPLGGACWDLRGTPAGAALAAAFWAAGGLVLWAAAAIDALDLLGLRQAWASFRGQDHRPPDFRTPGLYRWIRHPLMLGLLALFWATPRMMADRALLAAAMTAYTLVGVWLEERDLAAEHPEYDAYRRRTGRFLPRLFRRRHRMR